MLDFYGKEFLAPCPTPKLEDYPLSAVFNCLFGIFAAALHVWRVLLCPQPKDMLCHSDKGPTQQHSHTVLAIYWNLLHFPHRLVMLRHKSTQLNWLEGEGPNSTFSANINFWHENVDFEKAHVLSRRKSDWIKLSWQKMWCKISVSWLCPNKPNDRDE
jgi:hypothetical protein